MLRLLDVTTADKVRLRLVYIPEGEPGPVWGWEAPALEPSVEILDRERNRPVGPRFSVRSVLVNMDFTRLTAIDPPSFELIAQWLRYTVARDL
jgi:hypothetical protein